jgi:uncharacterized membrane protein (UPF0127 family)
MSRGCAPPVTRVSRLAASVLALALVGGAAAAQDCAPEVLDLRDADSTLRFRVEVADTDATRAYGLMNRDELARFSGMLFVYPEAGPVAFWMRNTRIPLDMLFFDSEGRLTHVHENAIPFDETAIPGGNNVRFVLEINGGLTSDLGIELGAELRHPAVDQEIAAWPCAG